MSLFKYIAILGRQPELGLVELESRLGAAGVEPFGRHAALVAQELPIDELGGVIKLARVLYDGPLTDVRQMPVKIDELPLRDGKAPFTVSLYGQRFQPRFATQVGLELKKRLKARGSVRFVAPGEGTVATAAQLHHNRVLEHGFELVVVSAGQRLVVAQTIGVQNIDWYSKRDYDRPARSAKVGMLPPKLAQVLVNTTSASIVVDPFCGTGVVLQEALLMGRAAVGSDLSEEMVAASQANLAWLATARPVLASAGAQLEPEAQPTPLPAWDVELADARQVKLSEGAALVSEGYLGPNLVHSPTLAELAAIRQELGRLYRECLAHWAAQLPAGAEVSLCVPAWRMPSGWQYLDLVDELPKLGYTLKGYKYVRTPLLYARDDQVVGRQLLLLRKH